MFPYAILSDYIPMARDHAQCRQLAPPQSLSRLETILRIERVPSIHGTGLAADHAQIAIVWRKVRHLFRELAPWVPDDEIRQVFVAHNVKERGSGRGRVVDDARAGLLETSVYAIDF